jgi:hypothetical protein
MSSASEQTDLLFKHANRQASAFSSPEGQAWASISIEGIDGHQVWPVRSPRFRDWLASSFFKEHDVMPHRRPLLDAIRMFESLAHTSEVKDSSVVHRVKSRGNEFYPEAILLDLGNAAGEVVEIRTHGWSIDTGFNFFRHSRGDRALPVPQAATGDQRPLTALRHLLGIHDEVQWTALAAWLAATLRPTGPYPILILSGPPACGKTTLARMLRALVDPCTAPLLPLPDSPRALLQMAWHYSILAFDEVPRLSDQIATTLARIASGTGYGYNDPHDRREPLLTEVKRPIILTIPSGTPMHRALASSSIVLELPKIATQRRRAESDLWTRFASLHPVVLGSLCSAVSSALARIHEIDSAGYTRFPDAATWAVAAAPALRLTEANIALALNPDPYVSPLTELVRATGGSWSGSATDLLTAFRARQIPKFPGNPRSLMQRLNRAPLPIYGLHLAAYETNRGRRISITQISQKCVVAARGQEVTALASNT